MLSKDNALSILLIDNDDDVRDSLMELLEIEGFQVHTATGGAESIAVVSSGLHPDIVIADYRMPNQNGVEVVRSVRQFIGEEVPAIIFTGDTSGKEIAAAYLKNCKVLSKPHDLNILVNAISDMAA